MVGSLMMALAPASAEPDDVKIAVGKENQEIIYVCADVDGAAGGSTCGQGRKLDFRSRLITKSVPAQHRRL